VFFVFFVSFVSFVDHSTTSGPSPQTNC